MDIVGRNLIMITTSNYAGRFRLPRSSKDLLRSKRKQPTNGFSSSMAQTQPTNGFSLSMAQIQIYAFNTKKTSLYLDLDLNKTVIPDVIYGTT